MRVVGSAKGIDIHAPDDAYFSYFNSPYIGHNSGSAIDIYPHHQEWGGEIEAPVTGKIVKIKCMKMGQPKPFPTDELDFGIGILPEGSYDDIVRVMHCEPSVVEGETISLGDQLGTAIRSRYFNYWTGPHYHVEIMSLESFERSSQSYPLSLNYQFYEEGSDKSRENIEFIIDKVTEDHIVGYPSNLSHSKIGDLSGLSANLGNGKIVGILDGGLSHYKIGGVIGSDKLSQDTHVFIAGSSVGTVRNAMTSVSVFTRGPGITVHLNDIQVRGLSCFIYPKHYSRNQIPQLIVIPKSYGQFKDLFEEGDVCELKVSGSSNMIKAE